MRSSFIVVALLLAFFAVIPNELKYSIFPQDEGLLLVYPTQMLKGAAPNHTFDSVYGIVGLWSVAIAFKIFGATLAVERLVGLVYRLTLVGSLVVHVWRKRGPVAGLAAGAISIVLLSGTLGLAAFSWLGAVALGTFGLLMIDVSQGNKTAPLVLAGISFGVDVGFRLDMGLAVILILLVLVAHARVSLRPLFIGLAIGLVPLCVNVVQAGLPAVIRDQLIDPIFVSGPYRHLPLSNLTWQELILLALCVAVTMVTIGIGIVTVRRERSDWNAILMLSTGAFELGILAQAFQRSDTIHLAYVACFVLPAAILVTPVGRFSVHRSVVDAFVPILYALVLFWLAWPAFGQIYWSNAVHSPPSATPSLSNDGRSVILGSTQDVRNLSKVLQEVDSRSRPGQRIFVGPSNLRTANYNDTFIYFLLPDLVPGSYYLEMNPGVSNGIGSTLAANLRTDDLLILSRRWNASIGEGTPPPLGLATANRIVREDFRRVTNDGPWTLYERKT